MSRFTMPLVGLTLFAIALAGAGWSMRQLDEVRPAPSFNEMMYLPDGAGLKILALGFDAPIADVLYLNTLMYYTDNLRAQARDNREAQHKYLAKSFSLIAMLSPRFHAAYYSGGLLLSAARKPVFAIELMEKGFAVFPDDWRFPVHMAVMAQQQLKDHALARRMMERAAKVPGISPAFMRAIEGIVDADARKLSPAERVADLIVYWEHMLADPAQPEQVRTFAEGRLRDLRTMQAALATEGAARRFIEREKRPPADIGELVRSGYLKSAPEAWLEGDTYLLLPDGSCRSAVMVRQATAGIISRMRELIASYRKKHGVYPPDLEALVRAKRLREIPVHPLASLGSGFVYNPATGEFAESAPARR